MGKIQVCGSNVEIKATGKVYEVPFTVSFVSDDQMTHPVTTAGGKIISVRILSVN
jgi:hypothetical protein